VYIAHDVSSWNVLQRLVWGSRNKVWLRDSNGTEWLFKESRGECEYIVEKLASELAASLNLPHAEVELATRNGKGVSAINQTTANRLYSTF